MRCRRRGCQRKLAKNATSIACSEFCAEVLRQQCLVFLAALDGDASVSLGYYKDVTR